MYTNNSPEANEARSIADWAENLEPGSEAFYSVPVEFFGHESRLILGAENILKSEKVQHIILTSESAGVIKAKVQRFS